jgi:hypothetical protein
MNNHKKFHGAEKNKKIPVAKKKHSANNKKISISQRILNGICRRMNALQMKVE